MKTELVPISSYRDSKKPHPWYAYDVDLVKGELTLATSKTPAQVGRKLALKLAAGHETEPHVLAVTTDGNLEFVPQSQQRPVYWAHLGFYDPKTDVLKLLEFKEAP